jgi:uncharacterized cupredoxin-like copper-binding protein
MRTVARCVALLVVLGLLGVVVGLGRSDARQTKGKTIAVTVSDFRIEAPRHVPSGDVVFVVHNKGPDVHEFIVVRTAKPLPLRKDGITADEDALKKLIVGVLEPGQPGTVRELRVRLPPGRYELICNMSGHYLGGMRTQIVAA